MRGFPQLFREAGRFHFFGCHAKQCHRACDQTASRVDSYDRLFWTHFFFLLAAASRMALRRSISMASATEI